MLNLSNFQTIGRDPSGPRKGNHPSAAPMFCCLIVVVHSPGIHWKKFWKIIAEVPAW